MFSAHALYCELSSALEDVCSNARQPEWSGWFSGIDGDKVFADDASLRGVQVFVSDMYTAMNPTFLKAERIDIVVNTLGPPDLVDEANEFWGPTWHFHADSANPKKCKHWEWFMTSDRLEAAQRYLRGPAAFYADFVGGIRYVEEACADSWSNRIAEHWLRVNAQLPKVVDRVFAARGKENTEPVRVLFHCWAGRNRSGAAACAFWFFWKSGTVSMSAIVKQAVAQRTVMLRDQEHFLKSLLVFEAIWRAGCEADATST